MTEGLFFSSLFFLVSISISAVPLFLGMPGAPFISLVSFLLLTLIWRAEATQALAPRPVRWRLLAFAGAVSIFLCVLGGEGHFFYANPDWLYRDAVLTDLARQPWPVTYRFQNHDWLLRAPLGMYMLPALVEKISGYPVAQIALLVQNVVIFSSIFYFIVPTGATKRTAFIVIAVFWIFGGWHLAGFIIRFFTTTPGFDYPASFFRVITAPQVHIDWWAAVFFQYPAAVTQIFWVPNHTIPAWVFACLHLRWIRSEISTGLVLATVPILAFWSPLAAFGMTPFAAHAVLKSLFNRRLRSTDILVTLAGITAAIPMLFYEGLGAGSVPHALQAFAPFFWIFYLIFISLTIVPPLGLILWAREGQKTIYDSTLLIAAAFLFLLPVYRLGLANDFVMRGASPALAILAIMLGIQCAAIKGKRVWMSFAIASLLIGSVTGALEINRALILARNPPPDCNLVQIWQMQEPQMPLTHYIMPVEAAPHWAITEPRPGVPTDETSACPRVK